MSLRGMAFQIDVDGLEKELEMEEPEYQTFMDFLKPVWCDD